MYIYIYVYIYICRGFIPKPKKHINQSLGNFHIGLLDITGKTMENPSLWASRRSPSTKMDKAWLEWSKPHDVSIHINAQVFLQSSEASVFSQPFLAKKLFSPLRITWNEAPAGRRNATSFKEGNTHTPTHTHTPDRQRHTERDTDTHMPRGSPSLQWLLRWVWGRAVGVRGWGFGIFKVGLLRLCQVAATFSAWGC